MAETKKGKSWSDLGSGEKKAVLVGWAAIVVVAAYFLWPGAKMPEQIRPAPSSPDSPASTPSVLYMAPGKESGAAATQLMAELEKAMRDGVDLLKVGDLSAITAHSRLFTSLAKSGESKFGATVFEPLGRCGVASTYARAWWQAQLNAAHHGGQDSTGAIKSALEQYQMNRTECLKSAGPTG